MAFTRRNVWAKNGDFDDPVLYWYARGVRVLRAKPISDPTSWDFLAAIHGFDPVLWHIEGFLTLGEKLPPYWVQSLYWKQCQHGSWYFLPWHRGYLLSFEAIVREAIKQEMIADEKKGIKVNYHWTDWALPYWNPADPKDDYRATQIPPAFTNEYMPDESENPLYIKQRYGPLATLPQKIAQGSQDAKNQYASTKLSLSLKQTLTQPSFMGTSASSTGFGGVKTTFSHEATTFGQAESSPHNNVHGLVGGREKVKMGKDNKPLKDENGEDIVERRGGLMGNPVTAGLDPLFWLHHANIDRLWEVWTNRNPKHKNPYLQEPLPNTPENEADNQIIELFNRTQKEWLDGPNERGFMVPLTSGQVWEFRPKDVVNTLALKIDYQYDLSYQYDDISDPLKGMATNPVGKLPENLGSTKTATSLQGANRTSIEIQMDKPVKYSPEYRFFLSLNNITSNKDGRIINVFVSLPKGAPGYDYPDLHAGSIAFFGVSQASAGGGLGVTEVFEITDIFAKTGFGGWDGTKNLKVTFIPLTEDYPADDIRVEQVCLSRESFKLEQ
ncbi:tyrosinase, putative [Sphaerospermopsis reniformis]|uniref:Tyrosinase, putative n=1 Tax=Sphaerospermopsis reniformis TaxID=531300 RepID=A0A479ZZC9_9CYAN|nr:tyrosinase family protein [Sphaerospermopsis reniformis]GCL35204.1 tyrosinase, putative [Sphaerospermopsis reniformis]